MAGLRRIGLWCLILAVALGPLAPTAEAQYFGRNKVQYRSFEFQVLETEHFDVHYYDEERVAAEQAARMAERWYARLSRILDHQLSGRQPLILYGGHPEFEQTNAIAGELGEGTGGVTEVLKRRIVLPLAASLAETDHVIGHELVHAFQFDITRKGGGGVGGGGPTALYLPLWFVEGMAEYLSIGPVDPHTAMWLRDAAHHNTLPSLAKLSDPKYFPYRYGQAFWSYVAGRWNDEVIGQILKATDRNGDVRPAFQKVLGTNADSLALAWHRELRQWNATAEASTDSVTEFARLVITGGGQARINVAPSLSPDGTRVMFLSERDLYSIELFLAEVATGRIIKRVTRSAIDPHLQSLQFIHSAGAWSPDGSRFAFGAVADGRPVLKIIDVESGKTRREIKFDGLGEIFNPTWSPDGRRVAVSAMAGGISDLVLVDLDSGSSRRLTDDVYADLSPAWSPDGKHIAFVTDRYSFEVKDLRFGHEQLALIDPESGHIEELRGADQGKNIHPQWSMDGQAVYFVSDRSGISNLYRVPASGGAAEPLTNLLTGVSGVTRLSPALSSARHSDLLVFSAYEAGAYSLYAMDGPGRRERVALATPLDPAVVATLPPVQRQSHGLAKLIGDTSLGLSNPDGFRRSTYRAGLAPDMLSAANIGFGAGSSSVAVSGGVALGFSDMLGNNHLLTALQVNNAGGSFGNNLAALVAYQNLESRWNWGLGATQLPFVAREFVFDEVLVNGDPVLRERDFRFWQIERELQGSVSYPFSRVQRFELAAGYRNISFVREVETRIFSQSGELLEETTESLGDNPSALNLITTSAALVHDSAIFGGTSPIIGQSYRLQLVPVFGTLHYAEALGDFRRYVPLRRPFTLAGRVIHFGRYGRDGEDTRLSDVFVGSPGLIHGYDDDSFALRECSPDPANPQACPEFDRLFGSRIAVGNLEVRMPLFGAAGVLPSPGAPPVELAGFYDAGVAWRKNDEPDFLGGTREMVTSYGGALRVNLFGLAIGEVAYVHPNDRPLKSWHWQFNLQPGF